MPLNYGNPNAAPVQTGGVVPSGPAVKPPTVAIYRPSQDPLNAAKANTVFNPGPLSPKVTSEIPRDAAYVSKNDGGGYQDETPEDEKYQSEATQPSSLNFLNIGLGLLLIYFIFGKKS